MTPAERAPLLLEAARDFAAEAFATLPESFPRKQEHWEFLATVAAVGTGILAIPDQVPRKQRQEVSSAVWAALEVWSPHGPPALKDFCAFLQRNLDAKIELQLAIGM